MDRQPDVAESVRLLVEQGEALRQRVQANREQMRIRVAAMKATPGEKVLAAIRSAKAGTRH